jgi:hypothetical protein
VAERPRRTATLEHPRRPLCGLILLSVRDDDDDPQRLTIAALQSSAVRPLTAVCTHDDGNEVNEEEDRPDAIAGSIIIARLLVKLLLLAWLAEIMMIWHPDDHHFVSPPYVCEQNDIFIVTIAVGPTTTLMLFTMLAVVVTTMRMVRTKKKRFCPAAMGFLARDRFCRVRVVRR